VGVAGGVGQSRRGREAGFGWLGRHMGQVRGREGGFGWQGAAHEAGEGAGAQAVSWRIGQVSSRSAGWRMRVSWLAQPRGVMEA
jgi:hypothetical protein